MITAKSQNIANYFMYLLECRDEEADTGFLLVVIDFDNDFPLNPPITCFVPAFNVGVIDFFTADIFTGFIDLPNNERAALDNMSFVEVHGIIPFPVFVRGFAACHTAFAAFINA
jgi:hypothetical protein